LIFCVSVSVNAIYSEEIAKFLMDLSAISYCGQNVLEQMSCGHECDVVKSEVKLFH